MGKREREREEYGRDLTRGERAYLVADRLDKRAAGLIGRCTLFCGDAGCRREGCAKR